MHMQGIAFSVLNQLNMAGAKYTHCDHRTISMAQFTAALRINQAPALRQRGPYLTSGPPHQLQIAEHAFGTDHFGPTRRQALL
jgi:hypothetical protein